MTNTMTKLLAAAALFLAACAVDQTGPQQPGIDPSYPAPHNQDSPEVRRVLPAEPGTNICNMLPSEGACSLACDPAALAEKYIPVNTCLDYACTLSDGQTIHVGGCR
jgi:hypothetical protein